MKHTNLIRTACITLAASALLASASRADDSAVWDGYLDYAYIYSSAEPEALTQRLAEYGTEAGLSLDAYLASNARSSGQTAEAFEGTVRRRAIAELLVYLSSGDANALEASAKTIRRLEKRLGPHENRYWYEYILAHESLERGRRFEFVEHMLDLWLGVVVPLEAPFETLQNLALNDSANSGFVSSLPYLYENIARLILIRSQQMGQDRSLDPLSAIVRLLDDGRVGAHPEIIPPEVSSRAYLDRIIARLNGPESDAGSLTFTLSLFDAAQQHERARGLLANQGFAVETLEALRATTAAYERALDRADTAQGQCAVYTRVLRQIGETYAAKQRLGADPEMGSPFTFEGAIEVYSRMKSDARNGIDTLGYGITGHASYVQALQRLWEEIQEGTLNAADYYLAQSVAHPEKAEEHTRNAARLYSRYLEFFQEFAGEEAAEHVPDSAYFAAYEAGKGYGDALLRFAAGNPSPTEVERAVRRYRVAMRLFPFDRALWPALTEALGREGREHEYLTLVRPIAESVMSSRAVERWIDQHEPGSEQITRFRSALSDSLVIMHLGFGDAEGIFELETGLENLRARRREVEDQRNRLLEDIDGPESQALATLARERRKTDLQEAVVLVERLDRQIDARSRALPLYQAAVESRGLGDALRSRRDHPGHTLLRRMYFENRS